MTFFKSGTGAVIVSGTTALAAFFVVALGETASVSGLGDCPTGRQT